MDRPELPTICFVLDIKKGKRIPVKYLIEIIINCNQLTVANYISFSQGDSGGPLHIKNDTDYHIVGVVSWGEGRRTLWLLLNSCSSELLKLSLFRLRQAKFSRSLFTGQQVRNLDKKQYERCMLLLISNDYKKEINKIFLYIQRTSAFLNIGRVCECQPQNFQN